jgi:hypothetical protein
MTGHPPQFVSVDDLAGLAEIADALGVSRQAVSNWTAGRSRESFPPPLKCLRCGPLYSLSAVKAWYMPWRLEARERWETEQWRNHRSTH